MSSRSFQRFEHMVQLMKKTESVPTDCTTSPMQQELHTTCAGINSKAERVCCQKALMLSSMHDNVQIKHRPVTSVGHQEGKRVFWEEAQFFWTVSNSFKRCPANFSRGDEKNFRGGCPPDQAFSTLNLFLDFVFRVTRDACLPQNAFSSCTLCTTLQTTRKCVRSDDF